MTPATASTVWIKDYVPTSGVYVPAGDTTWVGVQSPTPDKHHRATGKPSGGWLTLHARRARGGRR